MHWIAFYNRSEQLEQFNADETENRYEDIDRSRLIAFGVFDENNKPILLSHIPLGGRLIYRKRIETTGDPTAKITVWIVGVQVTEDGVNKQSIAAIFPDGHIETMLHFREGTRWFYPPQLLPHEGS